MRLCSTGAFVFDWCVCVRLVLCSWFVCVQKNPLSLSGGFWLKNVYCVFCVLLVKEMIPQKALNKKMNPAKAIGKTTPILKPQRMTKTPMKICKSVKSEWMNKFVIVIFLCFLY